MSADEARSKGAAPAACEHERSHIVDSRFFQEGYSTSESRRIFCDVCRIGRWLTIEAALAESQAEIGMIPQWAAAAIRSACRLDAIDLGAVRTGIAATGHSLVPLLRAVSAECGEALDFVHFGATTQDIQDSAQAMEMREVLDLVSGHLDQLLVTLGRLADQHRDTLMTGRTHAQPALPTTFGLKVATWMDELLRHRTRLGEARSRVVVAQLFGGVGTMAAFGSDGPRLLDRFAARLDLGVPLVAWHAARDRIAEYVTTLALLAATLGRIADEIRTLSRPEIAEVEEQWRHGQVGSSTMPHKRNPERCEQVVALARLSRAQVSLALEAMAVEHERDYRGTRMEWCAVADISHFALAALALTHGIVADLQVHAERMSESAMNHGDELSTEALMMAVARRAGRERAHGLVYEVSQRARQSGIPLRQAAAESAEMNAALAPTPLSDLLDPRRYVGIAGALVARVLREAAGVRPRHDRERPSAAVRRASRHANAE